jgi:hypothetical protein
LRGKTRQARRQVENPHGVGFFVLVSLRGKTRQARRQVENPHGVGFFVLVSCILGGGETALAIVHPGYIRQATRDRCVARTATVPQARIVLGRTWTLFPERLARHVR